ncbi:MAG: lasso peptide biosynthesis B2 protein [Rhodospirillaceae bacterium]
MTAAEIALALEALVLLALATLALRLLPFRWIAGRLGECAGAGSAEVPEGTAFTMPVKAVRRAIVRARRRAPWPATCLAQALAGRIMLGRRGVGSSIHFGVSNTDGFAAHAWLIAGGEAVTGTEIAGCFVPIAQIRHQV